MHQVQAPTLPAASRDAGTTDVSAVLYRAAIGARGQARYLTRFQAFDAGTRPGAAWHWPAFASAFSWLATRGLWLPALAWLCGAWLASITVLGAARLIADASPWALCVLMALLILTASGLWGLWADTLLHRLYRQHILNAVAGSDSVQQACARLAPAPATPARWVAIAAINAMHIAALAGGFMLLQADLETPAAVLAVPTMASPPPVPAPATEPPPAPAPCADCAEPTAPETPASLAAPVLPAGPAPAPSVAAPAAGGRFAVQIGVFGQPANADRVQQTLRAQGLPVYVEPIGPHGQQRVRVGPFAQRGEAQKTADRMKALDLPAVVVRLR